MTKPGVLLPSGRVYEHSFTLAALADLEAFILSHDRTVTLAEVAAGDTDPRAVAVRHDVDHSLEHALRFARWEHARGIRSSYYLLPRRTGGYWSPRPVYTERDTIPAPTEDDTRRLLLPTLARELEALGHEVGLHNDSLSLTGDDPDAAVELLRAQADEMRSWGLTVTGCADHGGRISGTKLWRDHGRKPADAGFEYEAYELMGRQPTTYISDNHGRWRAPLADEPGKLSLVLVHPVHWELS